MAAVAERQLRLKPDERRQQILEATLLCLARDGAGATSLRSVCREIGVAPSLITHYFGTWHDLLRAAYDLLTERFMAALRPLLTAPFPSARARMRAIIRAYIGPEWCGGNTLGASLAFWELSRGAVDFGAPFTRFLDERRALIRRAFTQLAAEERVRLPLADMTACLLQMLDGFWLEMALNPQGMPAARAEKLCWSWIELVLGGAGARQEP